MKKLLLIPVLLLVAMFCHAQYIHKIKADSVLITNDSCNAELNLENSTKDTLGFASQPSLAKPTRRATENEAMK